MRSTARTLHQDIGYGAMKIFAPQMRAKASFGRRQVQESCTWLQGAASTTFRQQTWVEAEAWWETSEKKGTTESEEDAREDELLTRRGWKLLSDRSSVLLPMAF